MSADGTQRDVSCSVNLRSMAVGAFLPPQSADVDPPGSFPGVGREKSYSSFVFINFSGYPVKERIEEPEVSPDFSPRFGKKEPERGIYGAAPFIPNVPC